MNLQFGQDSAETTDLQSIWHQLAQTDQGRMIYFQDGLTLTEGKWNSTGWDVGQGPQFFSTWSLHEAQLDFPQRGGLRVATFLNMVAGFLQRAKVEAARPS